AASDAVLIERPAASQAMDWSSLAFAMVLILLTYGGWNDAAFVAAEVRDKKRDIPLSLILGVAIITLVYLLVNLAYLRALGLEGVQQSKAVAAEVLRATMGEGASNVVSLLVMISALGAINGLIFTGSRVYATLGADHGVFAWLSGWTRGGSPITALITQAVIALAMITAVGTAVGQATLNQAFVTLGLDDANSINWAGRGGFDTLLKCSAPIFWLFFLLTSISVFILRVIDRDVPRPFKVPLFPVVPAVFTLTCGYMLYSGTEYAGRLGLVGAGLLLAGVPLYLISKPRRDAAQQ
ncbi:MAG TPA: amino acid permease, partial [Burkholderiaceae bacterium]|nr:amino acid permease [Burkholderiaceae bacterium]